MFYLYLILLVAETQALFFPPAILDLPKGLFKCFMFQKGYGCPHEDIKFILYTP